MTKSALIIVDVQNDFCPGGTLAVPYGDEVVKPVNRMVNHALKNDWLIIASRDWHPKITGHFKNYGGVWPEHCVMFEKGAEFHSDLVLPPTAVIISKGMRSGEDAYSAFESELEKTLRNLNVKTLYIGGLATDYCVKATVLDALKLGFKVYLLTDAIRAVNIKPTDGANAIAEMKAAGKKAGKGKFVLTSVKEILAK